MDIEHLVAYRKDWELNTPSTLTPEEREEWYRQNPTRRFGALAVDDITETPLVLHAEGERPVVGTAIVSIKDCAITVITPKVLPDNPLLHMTPTGVSLTFSEKRHG